MYQIGDKLTDLSKLTVELDDCVVLAHNVDISKISTVKYLIEQNMYGGHVITRKPESFAGYVKDKLTELLQLTDETQEIRSFGKPHSERTTIHHTATDLNIKVTVKKSNSKWLVNIIKEGEIKKPWWTVKLQLGRTTLINFGKKVKFSNFRAQVYRWAKSNDKTITVIKSENDNEALVTYAENTRPKSNQVLLNEFLDSLSVGETKSIPVTFNTMSDGYIRSLVSLHNHDISYSKGSVTHNSPAPRFDHHGSFIYNGKNWGKREPQWIELKLKRTNYNYEDIK